MPIRRRLVNTFKRRYRKSNKRSNRKSNKRMRSNRKSNKRMRSNRKSNKRMRSNRKSNKRMRSNRKLRGGMFSRRKKTDQPVLPDLPERRWVKEGFSINSERDSNVLVNFSGEAGIQLRKVSSTSGVWEIIFKCNITKKLQVKDEAQFQGTLTADEDLYIRVPMYTFLEECANSVKNEDEYNLAVGIAKSNNGEKLVHYQKYPTLFKTVLEKIFKVAYKNRLLLKNKVISDAAKIDTFISDHKFFSNNLQETLRGTAQLTCCYSDTNTPSGGLLECNNKRNIINGLFCSQHFETIPSIIENNPFPNPPDSKKLCMIQSNSIVEFKAQMTKLFNLAQPVNDSIAEIIAQGMRDGIIKSGDIVYTSIPMGDTQLSIVEDLYSTPTKPETSLIGVKVTTSNEGGLQYNTDTQQLPIPGEKYQVITQDNQGNVSLTKETINLNEEIYNTMPHDATAPPLPSAPPLGRTRAQPSSSASHPYENDETMDPEALVAGLRRDQTERFGEGLVNEPNAYTGNAGSGDNGFGGFETENETDSDNDDYTVMNAGADPIEGFGGNDTYGDPQPPDAAGTPEGGAPEGVYDWQQQDTGS